MAALGPYLGEDTLPSDTPGPIVVGIDPSLTHTAVCAYDLHTGGHLFWGVRTAPEPGTNRLFVPPRRLAEVREGVLSGLAAAIERGPIGHVCMESYAFSAPQGATAMGEVHCAIRLGLFDSFGDRPLGHPTAVTPSQLKSFAGAGNKKSQVLLAVYRKWKVDLPDDNMADAYVLARLAASLVSGDTKYEYETPIVDKVRGNAWKPELLTTSRSSGSKRRRQSSL